MRNRKKNEMWYSGRKVKDKQDKTRCLTKHYIQSLRLSNTNSSKNRGELANVLREGKQFLNH